MPSFFFHVAFDLDASASLLGNRLQPASRKQDQRDSGDSAAKVVVPDSDGEGGQSIIASSSTGSEKETGPATLHSVCQDWRYDKISFQDITMASAATSDKQEASTDTSRKITSGISAGPGGLATKGRYEPCDPDQEELGWGVVRLYRDSEETPGLYDEPTTPRHSKPGRLLSRKEKIEQPAFRDEDCTTLCILAVPSYLTPSDFLGFVGEKTRDLVSHFRMIRTERGNRYMVLMKFRNGRNAREWRREWNGKAFDGMEVGFLGEMCWPKLTTCSLRIVMSSLSSRSNSGHMRHLVRKPPFRTCPMTLSHHPSRSNYLPSPQTRPFKQLPFHQAHDLLNLTPHPRRP